MNIPEIIRQLEENPSDILHLPEVRTPEVFDPWIRRCLELTAKNPREGLPHVDTALVIATTTCQNAQCLGVSAAARRNLGEPERALWLLEDAIRLSRECALCEADLLRRRSLVQAVLGKEEEALLEANGAIRSYTRLDSPGHDLHGCGLGKSYMARGEIHLYFGHVDRSVDDFARSLRLISPAILGPFRTAVLNLGTALKTQGGLVNLLTADQHIREAWKYFKARKGEASRERAHLDWQTAMVRFELRRYPEGRQVVRERPAQLRDLLVRSRNDFIELGMPAESAAVAADLARVLYPKRLEVKRVMDATFKQIRERWATFEPEVRTAFLPVRDAMLAVRHAVDSDVMTLSSAELHNRIRDAIERLREAAGQAAKGRVLPCLLSFPVVK